MKIAILTSGILPVPAVQGGAVENLIDFYLEYNDLHHLHDITVYSVWHPDVVKHPALQSEVNHYVYLKTNTLWAKAKKMLHHLLHKDKEYYHHSVEFYLDWCIKKIRGQRFDAIIIENRPAFAIKLSQVLHTPIATHMENDFLNNTTQSYRLIHNATTGFINTSDFISHQVSTVASNKCNSFTVYNGIDVDRFYQATPFDRKILGMGERDFVIVYSGRLIQEKGILELIRATKKLNDIPDLKLLIIGANAYGMGQSKSPFICKLEEESEPIKDKVIYTGFVSYNQIPSYLKMADIAVVPSMWDEPFGLTVVEAMAAGLPLITTNSGGIPEICTGVAEIVEREDIVVQLAKKIRDLYSQPAKRREMAHSALERSRQFSKEKFAKDFFIALSAIANSGGGEYL